MIRPIALTLATLIVSTSTPAVADEPPTVVALVAAIVEECPLPEYDGPTAYRTPLCIRLKETLRQVIERDRFQPQRDKPELPTFGRPRQALNPLRPAEPYRPPPGAPREIPLDPGNY
jgi:hypothetical protein